jgi:hypothetical protein
LRASIWKRLSTDLKPDKLSAMSTIVALEEIPRYMDDILGGETVGRIVADLSL